MTTPWLLDRRYGSTAAVRLFCFPFAGGSASAYHAWPRQARDRLHVCGVEYPGRGMRLAERPLLSMPALVSDLADLLEPVLSGPYAFFGHSMGGLVAYELVRTLRDRGARLPERLFVSAALAPGQRFGRRPLSDATDEEVVDELRSLGGTPAELLADAELMQMSVRVLRADYTVLGTYEHRPAAPLDVPISVFGGWTDPLAAPDDLHGWRAHTTAGCRFRFFPGDHFYLHGEAPQLLRTIADELTGVEAAGTAGAAAPVA